MAVHLARCCHPLPGERIVGIFTTGKGVTIHTIDCETLENYQHEPQRWLDVGWDAARSSAHVGRPSLVLANEPGSPALRSVGSGRSWYVRLCIVFLLFI